MNATSGDQMNMVDRNEIDDELDEPMASQSVDSEAPLTHNSSKNNFFASPDEQPPGTQAMAVPRGSFKNTQGKFNPQYMKGSPHSSQRGKRSQTPDHMLASNEMQQGGGGVEMKPLHQVQTSMASNIHSPSIAQKVSRMGVPTPFAGVTSVPSPIRYSHPTVTSGARPEYISLAQQQTILSRPYDHDMSKSYSPGTLYGQATSPGRRYMSDGELLDSSIGILTSASQVVTSVGAGVDLTGQSSTSPQRTYYVWKDPPQTHLAGYQNHPGQGPPPGSQYPGAESSSSPVRHASYASQVGYYLQQQQPPQQQPTPQPPIQLQSGGPRTTPSGYPGGPVVPSGNMSSPTASASVSAASSLHMAPAVGYTTTGRPSTHQQQPMSFTRALEISENIDQQQQQVQQQPRGGYLRTNPNQPGQQPGGGSGQPQSLQPPTSEAGGKQPQNSQNNQEDPRRDSVYDMNSYEISV